MISGFCRRADLDPSNQFALTMQVSLQATVCGLCVIDPAPFADGLASVPFDTLPGTSLAFFVRAADGAILRFDPAATQIVSFTDDTGKDLAAAPSALVWKPVGHLPGSSEMVITLGGAAAPASDAACLQVHARLGLFAAGAETLREIPNVPLQPGWSDPGGLDIRIVETGAPEPGEGQGEFQFSVKMAVLGEASLRLIAVEFRDAAGELLSPISSTETASNGDRLTKHFFTAPTETAHLILRLWDAVEAASVAIAARLTLGLALEKR
jgi:hypothetical protein